MQARMTHPVMVLPDAMKALLALSKATKSGTVPDVTHALIHLRVSQINGCSVCVDMHARELKDAGERDERIWGVGAWRESPYFSVPVLNSKIAYTQVKDATLGPLGATYCKLGEGAVPVEKFITRLKGVGYTGYVTVEWEKAWLPNIAEPEEILPDAVQKLRKWAASGADEAAAEGDSEPAAATQGAAVE